MITMQAIITLFTDKLKATGCLNAALKKACWVAYKEGLKDGKRSQQLIESSNNKDMQQ